MKHICFVVNKYPNPKEPFACIFVQQLAWKMSELGIKVSVICPLPVNINPYYLCLPYKTTEITEKGTTVDVYFPKTIGLGQSKFFFGKSPVRTTTFFLKHAARRVIKKMKILPDVFYGHFISPSGVASAQLGREFNIPSFFACGEANNTIKHDKIYQFGKEKLQRELLSVKGVIAVSTALKKYLVDNEIIDEEKIDVFPNGFDVRKFARIDRYEARESLGLPQDKFTVSFLGAFNNRKGIIRVCQAIEEIDDSCLICAGFGDLKPYGDKCVFVEKLNHDKVPLFLSASDVFVLPTLNEGCCNAIVEAMACGLPIISSDRPFNDDILDDSCSIRVDPENVEEIRDAINRLACDKQLREKLSQGALNRGKELTLDVRARRIIEFIDERINTSKKETE